MTEDARKVIYQSLRVLGGTMTGVSYHERADVIHGMIRMANHLLPLGDYPTKDINDIFDTALSLRTQEYLEGDI